MFAMVFLQNKVIAIANLLAFVAGVMCMVAGWELVPEAKKADENCKISYLKIGLFSGVLCIIGTEWIIEQAMS